MEEEEEEEAPERVGGWPPPPCWAGWPCCQLLKVPSVGEPPTVFVISWMTETCWVDE